MNLFGRKERGKEKRKEGKGGCIERKNNGRNEGGKIERRKNGWKEEKI